MAPNWQTFGGKLILWRDADKATADWAREGAHRTIQVYTLRHLIWQGHQAVITYQVKTFEGNGGCSQIIRFRRIGLVYKVVCSAATLELECFVCLLVVNFCGLLYFTEFAVDYIFKISRWYLCSMFSSLRSFWLWIRLLR